MNISKSPVNIMITAGVLMVVAVMWRNYRLDTRNQQLIDQVNQQSQLLHDQDRTIILQSGVIKQLGMYIELMRGREVMPYMHGSDQNSTWLRYD